MSDYPNPPTFRNKLRGCGCTLGSLVGSLVPFVIVPLILLCVFGFAIKTTPEYECALDMAERSAQVVEVTGEPLKPGLFAWTSYFESGGGLRQGRFSTSLSGPYGKGKLQAEFYRTPIGATMGIWFKTSAGETAIYNGTYPCP